MQILKNTDKSFPCTNCGSENVSIVREDANNPRVKCNNCNFLFDGADALAAKESGGLKGSSEAELALAEDPVSFEIEDSTPPYTPSTIGRITDAHPSPLRRTVKAPRKPAYLFLSKDRIVSEIVPESGFKAAVLVWEQRGKYDCFQLSVKRVGVKIEVDG